MSPKYPDRQDKPYLVKRKKGALINIIVMSLFITPFLLGFIWTFIIEIFYPTSSVFFSIVITFVRGFTLIMMVPIVTFLLINSVKFHKARKMLKSKIFTNPRLDNSILEHLINNPGREFTIGELLTELAPEEGRHGMNESLDRLVTRKKILMEVRENVVYFTANLKKLGF